MSSYDGKKGVTVLVAKGASMSIARRHIKKSPLKPLAGNVQEVTIMIMKKASKELKAEFMPVFRKTVKSYPFYAKETGLDGNLVEVYGNAAKDGVVTELVIYNPVTCTLFSLRGSYPISELEKLKSKK